MHIYGLEYEQNHVRVYVYPDLENRIMEYMMLTHDDANINQTHLTR